MSSAPDFPAPVGSSWRVTRDGATVAIVDIRSERSGVTVAASLAAGDRPHRFDTLQAAEAFAGDLIASFACLGCDIAAA